LASIRDYLLFHDHHIAVGNKPPGMPVQPDPTSDISFQQVVQSYIKAPLHLVSRLDRPVSGLVLFAKTPEAAAAVARQRQEGLHRKRYLAIAEKKTSIPPEGMLENMLLRDPLKRKARSGNAPGAMHCSLRYWLLLVLDHYYVLEIELLTGRFHQIRAQLAEAGMPIRSDVKYGARRGAHDRSIGLHAWKISLPHPVSGQPLHFEAPLPDNQLWPVVAEKLAKHESGIPPPEAD
jgi:23S rRNA pseudouridine1911/1915/1917 synthase